ncbi:MAG: helix-turn-helix transcriptional regulator [Candidatus Edwardsbacteria bacterium]|nr:helix-turn-helix transcriptional regulator [Candidatus Edwardsbacteria bacterium]
MLTKANNIKIQFGQRIRQLRKQQGITQEELGFRANLHSTHIGMIERGVKNVSLETIEKLSDALGVSISLPFDEGNILKSSRETLIAEINGLMRKRDERTLRMLRNIIKDVLRWLKRQ